MNSTPSLIENYLWIPEVSDNAAPGLDPMITYIQSKCVALTALQNTIANIHNTIQNEINNLEIPNQGGSSSSKELFYTTTHTGYIFQKNLVNNHRTFFTQHHHFTYQRKSNAELDIHFLNSMVADLQSQINNITSSGSGGGSDPNGDPDIGTM